MPTAELFWEFFTTSKLTFVVPCIGAFSRKTEKPETQPVFLTNYFSHYLLVSLLKHFVKVIQHAIMILFKPHFSRVIGCFVRQDNALPAGGFLY